ncbi:MAG: SUMF1/EgtB/PvdO family nonheme iron enzyme [Byssovorax sp.]
MSAVRWIFPAVGAAIAIAAVGAVSSLRAVLWPHPGPVSSASAPPSSAPPPSASIFSSAAPPAPRPPPPAESDTLPATLAEQREELYGRMAYELELSEASVAEVRKIIEPSPVLGQGNPTITRHPMKRSECRAVRAAAGLAAPAAPHAPCRAKNMVPLYDPAAGETASDAKMCIDEFEFPGIPCEYPVVYARASQAALLCKAVGKRICDAHEWEGACAGALHKPEVEYAWGKPRPYATWLHNKSREIRWSYGLKKDHSQCATGAVKSPECFAGGWTLCGSNTYPAGSFPACVSPLGAYDLNGNAAEHMSLPLAPEDLGSRGGSGETEMKGSWFIFARAEAHEDDCRWRAKDWHPSRVADPESHRNYHLGFRCCQDVATDADAGP